MQNFILFALDDSLLVLCHYLVALVAFLKGPLDQLFESGLSCLHPLSRLTQLLLYQPAQTVQVVQVALQLVLSLAEVKIDILAEPNCTWRVVSMWSSTAWASLAASVWTSCHSYFSLATVSFFSASSLRAAICAISCFTQLRSCLTRSAALVLRAVSTLNWSHFCLSVFSSWPVSFFSSQVPLSSLRSIRLRCIFSFLYSLCYCTVEQRDKLLRRSVLRLFREALRSSWFSDPRVIFLNLGGCGSSWMVLMRGREADIGRLKLLQVVWEQEARRTSCFGSLLDDYKGRMIIIVMSKGSYSVRLCKIVSGGVRNIDSYYVVLRDAQNQKCISKAMRNDEENYDELAPQAEFHPACFQIYNYDKMSLVEKHKVDFKTQSKYSWSIYQNNLEVCVELNPPQLKPQDTASCASSLKNIEQEGASPERSKLTSRKSEKTSVIGRPPLPPKKEETSELVQEGQ